MNIEKFQVRTDLAFEAVDLQGASEVINEEITEDKLVIKRTIIPEHVANELGRRAGVYYALDTQAIKTHDHDDLKKCEDALTYIIKEVMKVENINPSHKGLVVGLGNSNVTPDSLGPAVIDNVIVTRHMFILNPEEVSEGISDVSAVAPGVMGNTGIETYDIVEAIINKIKIDYVVVVDALAAKSVARVNKTIQVTNTGISPGSGVGNTRKELSKQTLGIPVIAIGVPTVVDAVTIASDTIDMLLKYFNEKLNKKDSPSDKLVVGPQKLDHNFMGMPSEEQTRHLLGEFGLLTEEEKISLLQEVLTPNGYNLMVTPKEVDLDIQDLSDLISSAIDRALHSIVDNNYIIS
ncbi:MAG TPA: GPR endopeptidase [Acholeplasmataceae bacterium]|nr:GPR endopeptidase [Acholeplasmataceae bacterium]